MFSCLLQHTTSGLETEKSYSQRKRWVNKKGKYKKKEKGSNLQEANWSKWIPPDKNWATAIGSGVGGYLEVGGG